MKLFDPDHVEVLRTKSILARMAADDGDETGAVQLLKRIQAACESKKLGPNHPDAVQLLGSVGETYLSLGRHAEAAPLLQQVRDSMPAAFSGRIIHEH